MQNFDGRRVLGSTSKNWYPYATWHRCNIKDTVMSRQREESEQQ